MIAQFFQPTNQIVYLDEGMGDTSLLTMRAVSLCPDGPLKITYAFGRRVTIGVFKVAGQTRTRMYGENLCGGQTINLMIKQFTRREF